MSLRSNKKINLKAHRSRYFVEVDERGREDLPVQIRKIRPEKVSKKRRDGSQLSHPGSTTDDDRKLDFLTVVAGLESNDDNWKLESTMQFRKWLSLERSPLNEDITQTGIVRTFVEFLTRDDFPQLQLEAAWALTNIASGASAHTKVVIDNGAVPIFVRLLRSPVEDIREQAIWALANIAGDSPSTRDLVLSHGALKPVLALLHENATLSTLRNATWTLSNFCQGKPQPSFEQVKPALSALKGLVNSDDEEVIMDTCWALSYLSDGTNANIQAVIESGVCPRIVELLGHRSHSVLVPAIRTVGNIAAGDNLQTQCVIDLGALPHLVRILTHNYGKGIKREACWIISNITAGNNQQIQAVIDAHLIGPLVNMLQTAEFDIKKEAVWAVSNATSGGTHQQIKYLVSHGSIKLFCDLLVCSDPRIIYVCLKGIENILKVGEVEKHLGNSGDVNYYAQLIHEVEGFDKIENLQSHENNDIYERAMHILEAYYDDPEDHEESPVSSTGDGFNFV